MEHLIDKICSCSYCTKLDIMFGDPLLNTWEKKFIESAVRYGWISDYSPKQKDVIDRMFRTQRAKYKI